MRTAVFAFLALVVSSAAPAFAAEPSTSKQAYFNGLLRHVDILKLELNLESFLTCLSQPTPAETDACYIDFGRLALYVTRADTTIQRFYVRALTEPKFSQTETDKQINSEIIPILAHFISLAQELHRHYK